MLRIRRVSELHIKHLSKPSVFSEVFVSKTMNRSEAYGSGGRRGSGGRYSPLGDNSYRPKSQSPVTVDKSLDESSGSSGKGSRGRGRGRSKTTCSITNSPEKMWVQKSSQVFNEEVISSSKHPDEDNKDHFQSSPSSTSKDLNLSGGSLKDIELSCLSSVSSTRSQRVEPSSDHKSGGVGNFSNERNRGPFDIFLSKKGLGLKPSMLHMNREKRKATKGYTGLVIRPGMVLLKNYLSINDQVMIVNKCRELGLGEGGFYQPGYSDGALLRLKMMCLGKNWDPETSQYSETRPVDDSFPPKIPVEFNQFVENAIKESQYIDEIPFMVPDICIVNFYTSTGRLGLHQDKDESYESIRKGLPVVSFSLGDSAEFLYGDHRDADQAEKLVLESGDVLLFGGKSRNVFHGVRSIHEKTAPKVLVQETNLRPGRLNLTFRQY